MFIYAFKVQYKIVMQAVFLFISEDVIFCVEFSETSESC